MSLDGNVEIVASKVDIHLVIVEMVVINANQNNNCSLETNMMNVNIDIDHTVNNNDLNVNLEIKGINRIILTVNNVNFINRILVIIISLVRRSFILIGCDVF